MSNVKAVSEKEFQKEARKDISNTDQETLNIPAKVETQKREKQPDKVIVKNIGSERFYGHTCRNGLIYFLLIFHDLQPLG